MRKLVDFSQIFYGNSRGFIDEPLLSAPNTVITPHVAWAPKQTRERLLSVAVGNVKAYLSGAPRNVVSGGK